MIGRSRSAIAHVAIIAGGLVAGAMCAVLVSERARRDRSRGNRAAYRIRDPGARSERFVGQRERPGGAGRDDVS